MMASASRPLKSSREKLSPSRRTPTSRKVRCSPEGGVERLRDTGPVRGDAGRKKDDALGCPVPLALILAFFACSAFSRATTSGASRGSSVSKTGSASTATVLAVACALLSFAPQHRHHRCRRQS